MQPVRSWRLFLTVLFAAALGFTAYYTVRTVSAAIYWRQHRDEPIQRWMTIGYVAHSYHVPPWWLHRALGLPPEPHHRSLGTIARETHQSYAQIVAKLTNAITHARPPCPPLPPPPRPVPPAPAPAPASPHP